MAKTTVEILGGSLDGTVLNNMASEATMREVLAAVKKMGGGTGGGGRAGGSGGRGSSATKLNKSSSMMSKLAEGLGNQIGNTIGALGSMSVMLATNNTKLSNYTKVLNDQIISKLPIFGGLLGGVGSLLNEGISVLEDWNDSLKTGTQSGATFGNSILRASKAATAAGLNLDEYMKLVSQYSTTLLYLGDTVTEGAERFSSTSRKLVRAGGAATKTLRQMGYSSYMVNESFLKYIELVGVGMKGQKRDDAQLAKDFVTFQLNLVRMGYLTGQNVKKLEEQMTAVATDSVFQMKLATLSDKEKKKLIAAVNQFTALYGEAGGELFKALFLGMPPGSEDARNLAVLMPGLPKSMMDSIQAAKNGTASIEKYIEENEDTLIAAMIDSARRGNGIDQILALAGAGYGDAEKLRKSIEPILKTLNRYGNLADLNTGQLKAAFAQARKEAQEREKLTQFLNDMSQAFEEFKFSLMEAFYPVLEEVATFLETKDLPEKVRLFGVWLKDSVEKYLPDVITFFRWLGDENGRSYIKNEISYFFTRMGIRFEYFAKQMFGFDSPEEYAKMMQQDLDKAHAEYQENKDKLEPLIKSLRYVPGHKREGDQGSSAAPPQLAPGTGQVPAYAATARQQLAKVNPGMLKKSDETIRKMTEAGVMPLGRFMEEGTYQPGSPMGEDRGTHFHQGYDFKAPDKTGVYAAFDGLINYTMFGNGGYTAMLRSKQDPKLLLKYMHLNRAETEAMMKGITSVTKGQVIGKSGGVKGRADSGSSTGPHLHIEGTYDGQPFNVPEYMRHRRGTLGNYNSLFNNYGPKTDVVLDDVEAVMTPQQMNAVMNNAGNVATVEMLQSLDRNFSRLITIMNEKNNFSRSQLSIIEQNQVRIA